MARLGPSDLGIRIGTRGFVSPSIRKPAIFAIAALRHPTHSPYDALRQLAQAHIIRQPLIYPFIPLKERALKPFGRLPARSIRAPDKVGSQPAQSHGAEANRG